MASTEAKKTSFEDTSACTSSAAKDVGSTDHMAWLSDTLDVKLRSMEEMIEKRLRESLSSDMNGSIDGKDTKEFAHEEAQQKISRKIVQLEKSMMELGRKQRKHQTAFVDVRSISVVLKDTLSGIIRLVETLGVVVEPQIQDHSKLSTRLNSLEKCLLDAGIRKDSEAVPTSLEIAIPSDNILSDFVVEGEFRNACTELSEKVNQISRDFLWLDTREAGEDFDAKSISSQQQQSLPSTPQSVRGESHRPGTSVSLEGTRLRSASPIHSTVLSPPRPISTPNSLRVSKALPVQDIGSSTQSPEEVQKSSIGSSVQLLPANSSVVRQVPLASVPSWARTDIGTQSLPVGSAAGLSASMPAVIGGNLTLSPRVVGTSAGSIRVLHGSARSRSGSPSLAGTQRSGSPSLVGTQTSYKPPAYSAGSRSVSPSGLRTQQSSYTPSVTMAQAYSTNVPNKAQTQQSSYIPSTTITTSRAKSPGVPSTIAPK